MASTGWALQPSGDFELGGLEKAHDRKFRRIAFQIARKASPVPSEPPEFFDLADSFHLQKDREATRRFAPGGFEAGRKPGQPPMSFAISL